MKEIEVINLEIELLLQAIYETYHYDFRLYSRSSIRRRLNQVMTRFHLTDISEIQSRILHDKDFFPKLLSYLTVNTTELFRDPRYFLTLKEKVFPYLSTYPSLKFWVAGCSTGEEVVSLAILLKEANITKYLIYATDINPHNLEFAKEASYNLESVRRASANYHLAGGQKTLADYYSPSFDKATFHPELLSQVVYSDHSLATDSVFSEVHCISCRNVLIYFDRSLQEKALKLMKDSLVRHGFLGLGNKETIHFASIRNTFVTVDAENRIYQYKK